jgi:purine-binding chemotaxis protein CheW
LNKPAPQPQLQPTPAILDAPAQAIDDFLETLLEPVQEYHPRQEVPSQVKTKAKTGLKVEVKTEVRPQVPPPEVETLTANIPQTQTSVEIPPSPRQPDFTQEPFQCLLFSTSGMDFAIPLVTLHSIVKLTQSPAALPGQPPWHRGVLLHRQARVGLVDLGQLLGKSASAGVSPFVVILGEGRFGLLCDQIYRPQAIAPDQVKWRRQRVDRPWMLGTLREQLCPLIDTQALLRMLG